MKPLQFSDDQNYLELIALMQLIAKDSQNYDYNVLASTLLHYCDNLKENNFEKCQQIKESLLSSLNKTDEDEEDEDF